MKFAASVLTCVVTLSALLIAQDNKTYRRRDYRHDVRHRSRREVLDILRAQLPACCRHHRVPAVDLSVRQEHDHATTI